MTAMSAFARTDAAWLIADTGHYHGDGRIHSFGEKVVTDSRLSMMIGTCGRVREDAGDRIEHWLSEQPDQLTAFARLSALLCTLSDDTNDGEDAGDLPEGIRLTVAWWAPETRNGRCAIMATTTELAGGAQPYELRQASTLFMPSLGEADPWPGHSFDSEANALALAELQRRTVHDDGTVRVAGQMLLYRVDANGITSRELCRWPDLIGDRITA